MPPDEVLDAAVIAGLRRTQDAFGDPAFIRQLVTLFESRTPGKIDRIRQALAEGDPAAAREAAHALKSNCGMLGATGMAAACGRIEDASARGDLAASAEALREAEAQLPLVLAALSTLA